MKISYIQNSPIASLMEDNRKKQVLLTNAAVALVKSGIAETFPEYGEKNEEVILFEPRTHAEKVNSGVFYPEFFGGDRGWGIGLTGDEKLVPFTPTQAGALDNEGVDYAPVVWGTQEELSRLKTDFPHLYGKGE